VLQPGDWIEVRTPGGGGWGDPRDRDSARVARDVARGYITSAEAAADYGFAGQTPDEASSGER